MSILLDILSVPSDTEATMPLSLSPEEQAMIFRSVFKEWKECVLAMYSLGGAAAAPTMGTDFMGKGLKEAKDRLSLTTLDMIDDFASTANNIVRAHARRAPGGKLEGFTLGMLLKETEVACKRRYQSSPKRNDAQPHEKQIQTVENNH